MTPAEVAQDVLLHGAVHWQWTVAMAIMGLSAVVSACVTPAVALLASGGRG